MVSGLAQATRRPLPRPVSMDVAQFCQSGSGEVGLHRRERIAERDERIGTARGPGQNEPRPC